MHPRLIQLGHVAVPTAAVFTAIAIVVALFAARVTARRLDLDPEKVWDLGIVGVLTALFAPRLIITFANWSDFLAHPLWMIGIASVRSEAAILGGLAVALAAVGAFIFFTRMPFRRTLDALAPSLAVGFAIFNIGAFAGGSEFGTSTTLPWAVTYTRRLATLWYGTPLGTPLHPVQMYAAVAELCLFALLLAMIARRDAWKIRSGEIMGSWLFLHGASSFSLNFLRGALAADAFLFAEILAASMVLAGGVLWFSQAHFKTVESDLVILKTELESAYREKAANFLGYGNWNAPYWFIGQEEGEPPRQNPQWELRVQAWAQLNRPELCDCKEFHHLIGQDDLFTAQPRLVPTWKYLMLALLSFQGEQASLSDICAYQHKAWGRANGETCLLELSGVPARKLTMGRDLGEAWFSANELERMRNKRIARICEKIEECKPRLVLMYGLRDKAHWRTAAGQELIAGKPVMIGGTVFVMSKAPAAFGSTNEYWANLGKLLAAAMHN